jgi:hypothetical protein
MTSIELKDIIKQAKKDLRLAQDRLRTAQIRGDDVKADREWMYIGFYNEIIDNASADLFEMEAI